MLIDPDHRRWEDRQEPNPLGLQLAVNRAWQLGAISLEFRWARNSRLGSHGANSHLRLRFASLRLITARPVLWETLTRRQGTASFGGESVAG
ncbi:hypothetical protein FVEN_g12688 [Fusarium venenatum]|nr:hypothetical protein FVEN_g12688 [Fusarium venenatum]